MIPSNKIGLHDLDPSLLETLNTDGILPIEKGGTGASNTEDVRTNLETRVKTYAGFIHLGLDRLTVTIEELMRTMPWEAVLYADICGAEADNIDLYPAPHGILSVYKSEEHRAFFHFLDTNANKEYTASYAGAWSGWKEIFTIEGGELTGYLKFYNTNAYHALQKWRDVNNKRYSVTLGVGASGNTVLEHYTSELDESNSKLDGRFELGNVIDDPINSLRLMTGTGSDSSIYRIFGEHNLDLLASQI